MEFDGFNEVLGSMFYPAVGIAVFELVLIFVVPLLVIWMILRYYKNKTDKRAQIVQAAIEKNPDMDIEEFIKKLSPKQKTKLLKEKLLTKLLWGGIIAFLGIALLTFCVVQGMTIVPSSWPRSRSDSMPWSTSNSTRNRPSAATRWRWWWPLSWASSAVPSPLRLSCPRPPTYLSSLSWTL